MSKKQQLLSSGISLDFWGANPLCRLGKLTEKDPKDFPSPHEVISHLACVQGAIDTVRAVQENCRRAVDYRVFTGGPGLGHLDELGRLHKDAADAGEVYLEDCARTLSALYKKAAEARKEVRL